MKKIMDFFYDWNEKAEHFSLTKSWQYLLYIDLVLPGVLFLVAWLLQGLPFGVSLGRIFHTYNLYVASPIPNFATLTGVLGAAATIGLALWAVKRRDWRDLVLTLGLAAFNFVYFLLEWNYQLLLLLRLA